MHYIRFSFMAELALSPKPGHTENFLKSRAANIQPRRGWYPAGAENRILAAFASPHRRRYGNASVLVDGMRCQRDHTAAYAECAPRISRNKINRKNLPSDLRNPLGMEGKTASSQHLPA